MKQIILFVFFICSLPAQAQKTDTLTNAAIIEMIEFGFDESVIISKIRTSVANFDTSIDSLKYMKSKGVSNAILAKIVEVVNSSNQKPEASDEETQLTDLSDRITKEETIFNGGGLYNPFTSPFCATAGWWTSRASRCTRAPVTAWSPARSSRTTAQTSSVCGWLLPTTPWMCATTAPPAGIGY